jgi:rod shape-determining protein MreB and related proteins
MFTVLLSFWGKRNVGIDLGTANTLLYVSGRGLVLQEPSYIAVNSKTGQYIAVGDAAKAMMGKAPFPIKVIRPLRDGVIADFDSANKMINMFIHRALNSNNKVKNLVVGVPSGATDVEKRAVHEAVSGRAEHVFLIDEPLAAAIGAGLPVTEPIGSMIVDIGGGTTEIAIISLGGAAIKNSLRIAGDEFSYSIVRYVRKNFNIIIGEKTAEIIKIKLGNAKADSEFDDHSYPFRGIHIHSGLPMTVDIKAAQVRDAMSDSLRAIAKAIKECLELSPPELASDIVENGVMITGGGSLVRGINVYISDELGILTCVAEDPLLSVVNGTGQIVEQINNYSAKLSFT